MAVSSADRMHAEPLPPVPVPLRPDVEPRVNAVSLPCPLSSFVGREREVKSVIRLLQEDGVRLVSLVGPGGVGKSRLALRIADECGDAFRDGIWFVGLAQV